jgi:hypothetical protein
VLITGAARGTGDLTARRLHETRRPGRVPRARRGLATTLEIARQEHPELTTPQPVQDDQR